MKVLFLMLFGFALSSSGYANIHCRSTDQSWFNINSNEITIYDAVFDEEYNSELMIDKYSTKTFHVALEGSRYDFTVDMNKARLVYVYENTMGLTRRFYCEKDIDLFDGKVSMVGSWVNTDFAITIDENGSMSMIGPELNISGQLDEVSADSTHLKMKFEKLYFYLKLDEPNKLWLHYEGMNYLYTKVDNGEVI